jgi:NAD(P)-dependent dehydrogenase (short-subunit alcohol dehydrogenase family)
MLGRSHCEAVASMGGNPIILDLDKKEAELFASQLNQKYSVKAAGYNVDITNEKSVEKNVSLLFDKFGKIDGLVNNAANNPKVENNDDNIFTRLENFPLSVWQKDISVGLTGAFLCSKHYGNMISNNPNGGVILNISSD